MCTTCSVAKYYNKAELAEVKSSLINMEGTVTIVSVAKISIPILVLLLQS